LATWRARPSTGTAQYIAPGDLNVSYNFSSRSGGIDIDNFDNNACPVGRHWRDRLNAFGARRRRSERRPRTGAIGDTLTGSVSGAFVNNPAAISGTPNVAAGVVGLFDFTGASVNAVGTAAATFFNVD